MRILTTIGQCGEVACWPEASRTDVASDVFQASDYDRRRSQSLAGRLGPNFLVTANPRRAFAQVNYASQGLRVLTDETPSVSRMREPHVRLDEGEA